MGFLSRLFGARDEAPPPPPPVPPGKVWVMGTAPWGGVVLECGSTELVVVVLPVTDPGLYAKVPAFPPATVKAVIACNDFDHGVIAAREVAAKAGLATVYATDATKPVERGVRRAGGNVKVVQLRKMTFGHLEVDVHAAGAVWATWSTGVTALVGDSISLDALVGEVPNNVLGRIVARREPGVSRPIEEVAREVGAAIRSYVPVPNVPTTPGDEAVAKLVTDPAAPLPVAQRIVAAIVVGDLAKADALAEVEIAGGRDVAAMRFQRALVAMMRDDDALAIELLEQSPGDPKAVSSLGQLYARTRDPRARALADKALARLPGDPIAIRGAILAHALTGDPDGARAVLAAHGEHLPADQRAAFAASIDDPPVPRRHRFPEHAALCAQAAKPLVDDKLYAKAEPLLRRAVDFDPLDEHVVELGFVLGQLDRHADAIALYDEALANGGSPLLRFNRANCLLRMERFEAAIADYRTCIAAIPQRPDLRVNLVSALFASGQRAAAREELEALRRTGGVPAQMISGLERMLAGTL